MRILVTGGGGSLGRDLVPALLGDGHEVVALDRDAGALPGLSHPRLRRVAGAVEHRARCQEAVAGAEAVIHMAWSFSDDPAALLEGDLRGHQLLLDLCRAEKVRHLLYTSTAVVYGKPARVPIDEGHPLRVLEARKPSYGMAKEFAEKLTLLAARSGGPPATVFRFWWAFGSSIGGRHLKEMLRTAAGGRRLLVPGGCGGSFLSMTDFAQATRLALCNPRAFGEVFNLGSDYVTWEEVARMVVRITGSPAGVEVVPPERWTGAAFLADPWQLDDRRVRERLGWRPECSPAGLRDQLESSIARTWAEEKAARP